MKIHVFSIMWNEEFILPYFLRHYATFADRIFVIDDHSTDRTAEIAKAHPKVTLLDYEYEGLVEDDFNKTFAKAYKEHSRQADWAMCVDADELVYHPHITKALEHRQGVLKTTGYFIVSDHLPVGGGQIYDELFMGVRFPKWDKPIIFDPKLDVMFGDGRHSVNQPAQPTDIKLLHYRYMSRQYVIDRNTASYPRVDMTEDQREYRMKKALDWYDNALAGPLEKVV